MGALWDATKELIFVFLQQIDGFVGDWGLAIIVLTVLFRLVLMPLTIKQTRSMYEMQRIQPKIKELQAKYADDKEKLQEETLKFYQENKVNPLGGCLPALLQMPLFIALYQVLGTTKNGPGLLLEHLTATKATGSFFALIPDISIAPKAVFANPALVGQTNGYIAVIPYALLVLLFGLSVWLPQALMPGEKQQKMIGAYMGAMMLFFGWSSPAGVLLYWDVSSIWAVAQQQIMMASMKRAHGDEEPAVPVKVAKDPLASKKPAPKKTSGKRK